MKKTSIVVLVTVVAALGGCSRLHWSGNPTSLTGISGVQPDTSRPLPMGKEAEPFIVNIPLTPDDHIKAAQRYRDLANEYRREAASHQAMERLYGDTDPEMAVRCDRLVRELSALAVECEEIEKAHEKKAAALQGSEK